MKRYNNLFNNIISLDNLIVADSKARRGKINTYGVKLHDKNKDSNLIKLHNLLKTKTFKTSNYNIFKIYEPKEREIYRLPYFPDRIVHHAIMNYLEPIFLKVFTNNTYSCIKGRGISSCYKQVVNIIRCFKNNKNLYCLKIDIKKFYPSINHDILKSLIRRKIKDKDLLWLLDDIIDSAPGLPIGNYLSQFLANYYLCYFMHFVNEKLHKIIGKQNVIKSVEYADDIVFFSPNKKDLHKILPIIKQYLYDNLSLEIRDNYQIFPISKNRYDSSGRSLDFIGYRFFKEQILIRKRIKKNFCKKAISLNKKLGIMPLKYKIDISPWLGWIKSSNSINLAKTVIKQEYYESIFQ